MSDNFWFGIWICPQGQGLLSYHVTQSWAGARSTAADCVDAAWGRRDGEATTLEAGTIVCRALWAGLNGEKPESPRLSLMRKAVSEMLKIRILSLPKQ